MRGYSGSWIVAAGIAALGVGCTASSRFPPGLAARPLLPPKGVHQIVLGMSLTKPSEWRGAPIPFPIVAWRWAVSDSCTYIFPTGLGCNLGTIADVELAAMAGLGFGFATDNADRYTGDPRDPNDRILSYLLVPQLGVSARLPISRRVAFLASAIGGGTFFYDRWKLFGAYATGRILVDPADWLSLGFGVGISAGHDLDDLRPYINLGFGTVAGELFSGNPILSFHVADHIDIFVLSAFGVGSDGPLVWAVAGGVDWHFE